ncbi:MAG: VOC family protein [Actinophytocola sp.]|uniref:VOC family protein n=1 Tax=Actinophytocola sp. TaxID=1872138 RepID=UPI001322B8E1|nr:VOC family protein [Actinophytocola sp.]MPZ83584.1 VOC family protein [Actinophytocola sp.]
MSGEINWVELPAADTTKARAFYGGLFGWHTTDFGGDYHLVENGPAGAIAPREDDFTHPRVYFATDDADASTKRVHELGGTAEDIQAVPDVGRIVHCRDDQGTPFSLYEPTPRS